MRPETGRGFFGPGGRHGFFEHGGSEHAGPPWGRGPGGHFAGFFRERWADRGEEAPWGPGPFGRWLGGLAGGPGRERRYGRGDLKYLILDVLQEKPRHGYDVIRALEEQSDGFYSPSPGSVYPILQMLEDQGYVTGREQDGRKVYAITDEGRHFLSDRQEQVNDVRARGRSEHWTPEMKAEMAELMGEIFGLARALVGHQRRSRHGITPEKLRRIKDVVVRAHAEIRAILQEEPTIIV